MAGLRLVILLVGNMKATNGEETSGMKKTWLWMLAVFVLSLLFASAALAQQKTGWNRNGASWPGNLYDPKTVATVKGEVLRVEEFTPAQGMPPGVELLLKTDRREIIRIFLGPQWYLKIEDFAVEVGDRLDVKGSKITYEGKPALVAAVVFKGDEVLKFRDENGAPVWSAWAPRK
jgi:hypothetical protein